MPVVLARTVEVSQSTSDLSRSSSAAASASVLKRIRQSSGQRSASTKVILARARAFRPEYQWFSSSSKPRR